MTTGKTIPLTIQILSAKWCLPNFPSREQVSFNFMAAVTICSDFDYLVLKELVYSELIYWPKMIQSVEVKASKTK